MSTDKDYPPRYEDMRTYRILYEVMLTSGTKLNGHVVSSVMLGSDQLARDHFRGFVDAHVRYVPLVYNALVPLNYKLQREDEVLEDITIHLVF